MRRFIKRLLCPHPHPVSLERHVGSRTYHFIVCIRCGTEW